MQGQKPFDAPHDADALFHQVLSFALDTLRIFLLDARNLYISCHFTIARQPGAQCPRHALSIEAIRLGATATARHQEARRVKNNRTDTTRDQNPSKPETIVTNLIAEHDLQLSAQMTLSLLLAAVENVDQPIGVARPDLVHSSLAVTRSGKRTDPTGLTQLERCTAYIACINRRRHLRSSCVDHRSDRQGGHDSVPFRFIGSTTITICQCTRPIRPIPRSPSE